jgi:hypothetical protein
MTVSGGELTSIVADVAALEARAARERRHVCDCVCGVGERERVCVCVRGRGREREREICSDSERAVHGASSRR